PISLSAPADRSRVDVDAEVASRLPDPTRKVGNHRSGPASKIENQIAGTDPPESIDPVRHLSCRAFEEMYRTRLAAQPERRKTFLSRSPAAEGFCRSKQPQTCGTKLPRHMKRSGGNGSGEIGHASDHERYGTAWRVVALRTRR